MELGCSDPHTRTQFKGIHWRKGLLEFRMYAEQRAEVTSANLGEWE